MVNRLITVIVILFVAASAFGLDWYSFYFDNPELNTEYEITGTVMDVSQYEGVVAVILMTSFEVNGHFSRSPVMLWFDERPKVNDGDRLSATGTYSGIWDYKGMEIPTFKGSTYEKDD